MKEPTLGTALSRDSYDISTKNRPSFECRGKSLQPKPHANLRILSI